MVETSTYENDNDYIIRITMYIYNLICSWMALGFLWMNAQCVKRLPKNLSVRTVQGNDPKVICMAYSRLEDSC